MSRRVLFGALSVAVAILAPLAVLEIGLRLFGIGYGFAQEEPDPVFHHVHVRNYSFLSYSPGGEWDGGRVLYDENGFVADPNGPRRGASPCRIAFLGDSFTEARQVPYGSSFVGRLGKISPCETRNYGVNSYSPILYLLQWQRIVRDFRPDLVIVQLYSNDISDDREYAKTARYDSAGRLLAAPGTNTTGEVGIVRKLFRQSYLLRLVRRSSLAVSWWMANWGKPVHVVGGYVEEFPKISPLSSGFMKELSREVARDGAKLAIFVVPSKFRLVNPDSLASSPEEFSDEWKNWAAGNGVQFLDMVEPFRLSAENGHDPFFEQDIHFNMIGHEIAAGVICRRFPEYFSSGRC